MAEQKDYERKKQEDNIKYLYFSRYLMIRYSVVIFLFTNLIWLLILIQYQKWLGIVCCSIGTILAGMAAIEQLTKMHNRKADVPLTRHYLMIQIIFNCLLAIIIFLPINDKFFPFITTSDTRYLVLGLLFGGILLAYACERRIHNIRIGKDKYIKTIDTFKKVK
jgi:hypothetical protein